MSGCSTSGNNGNGSESSGEKSEDVVTLKVWAEKDGVDTVAKMVDSFKEHYKDEAEFDITIEIQSDSKVRDTMLTDVHNGADVFSFPDD